MDSFWIFILACYLSHCHSMSSLYPEDKSKYAVVLALSSPIAVWILGSVIVYVWHLSPLVKLIGDITFTQGLTLWILFFILIPFSTSQKRQDKSDIAGMLEQIQKTLNIRKLK